MKLISTQRKVQREYHFQASTAGANGQFWKRKSVQKMGRRNSLTVFPKHIRTYFLIGNVQALLLKIKSLFSLRSIWNTSYCRVKDINVSPRIKDRNSHTFLRSFLAIPTTTEKPRTHRVTLMFVCLQPQLCLAKSFRTVRAVSEGRQYWAHRTKVRGKSLRLRNWKCSCTPKWKTFSDICLLYLQINFQIAYIFLQA